MAKHIYLNNSKQKDFIRNKWIQFAEEIYKEVNHDFGILTFPAEEMQDLRLFKEKGFIDWEEVETESADGTLNYRITKGKIRCFEKKSSVQRYLNQRLIQAKIEGDFCPYIAANYSKIMSGKDKTFPVDVVNLDFDGRLQSNQKYPFEATIECIFEFQRKHKQNFSLFLTWPSTEDEDMIEYKELLENIIESNLSDPSAESFKQSFERSFRTIKDLKYERKSIIGIAKIIIKKASHSLYSLRKSEFFVYGGNEQRKRMISLMFNFYFDGGSGREHILYSKNVGIAMIEAIDVNLIIA